MDRNLTARSEVILQSLREILEEAIFNRLDVFVSIHKITGNWNLIIKKRFNKLTSILAIERKMKKPFR